MHGSAWIQIPLSAHHWILLSLSISCRNRSMLTPSDSVHLLRDFLKQYHSTPFNICTISQMGVFRFVHHSLESSQFISMIPITTRQLLSCLRPIGPLLQPFSAQKLSNTTIVWFPLGRFHGHQFVEILVHGRWFAGALGC